MSSESDDDPVLPPGYYMDDVPDDFLCNLSDSDSESDGYSDNGHRPTLSLGFMFFTNHSAEGTSNYEPISSSSDYELDGEPNQIIATLDFFHLANHGLLVPGPCHGTMGLHKRWQIPDRHAPSSGARGTEGDYFAYPKNLISKETLQFLGFTHQKAQDMWLLWPEWPAGAAQQPVFVLDSMDEFQALADAFVSMMDGMLDFTAEDQPGTLDGYRALLKRVGMSDQACDDILDPHFESLILSRSCEHWAKDTIRMRWATLLDIKSVSRKRKAELYNAGTGPSSGNMQAGHGPGGHGAPEPGFQSPSVWQRAPKKRVLKDANGPAMTPADYVEHTTVYKAVDQGRISRFLDKGVASLDQLSTRAPSDFSDSQSAYCFAADYSTAAYEAAYAKRRCSGGAVLVLAVSVPTCQLDWLVQGQQRIDVAWPSDEWKKLVFSSRRGQNFTEELEKYQHATLITGTMARKPGREYHKLASPQDVTQDHVVMSGSVVGDESRDPLTQYVFLGNSGHQFLKKWAEFAAESFTEDRYNAWLRDFTNGEATHEEIKDLWP